MCGLIGYIGKSKNPILTYQLTTKLFERTEKRGIDAAGYWGVQDGLNGKILYHKEPTKSSLLIKKDQWKKLLRFNPNLLLAHARAASRGSGEPSNNKNNHPFVSSCYNIGLIHNGKIDNNEYANLIKKYEVESKCDSEILLRIFEGAEAYPGSLETKRLSGIKDIFSQINHGHMAVVIGEKNEDNRSMWLFRNQYRPIWLVDIRDHLGQIFFVSEPSIWYKSLKELKVKIPNQKLIDLPINEIWHFSISSTNPTSEIFQRYQISKSKSLQSVEFLEKIQIQKKEYNKNSILTEIDNQTDDFVNKLKEVEILSRSRIPKSHQPQLEEAFKIINSLTNI